MNNLNVHEPHGRFFWSRKETSFVAGGGTKVIPVNSSVFWLDGGERFPQLPQVMDLQIVLFSQPFLKPELSMNDALPGVLSSAGCRLECILAALVDTKKWKRTWKFHSYVIKTYPFFVNIVCYRYIRSPPLPGPTCRRVCITYVLHLHLSNCGTCKNHCKYRCFLNTLYVK